MKIATILLSLDKLLIEAYLNNHKENKYTFDSAIDSINESLNESIIIFNTPISREKRMVLYNHLKSIKYQVEIVLMHTPLPILLERVDNKAALTDAYKYLATPRIGVDCDTYTVEDPYPFLVSNSDFNEILSFSKQKGILKTISKYISNHYKVELHNINMPHETPYHLESIEEHINMCINNSLDDEMHITALLHDLGKSVCKNIGSYKGHDKLSSIYAVKFFNEVLKSNVDSDSIIEIINQHMNAHRGISLKVQTDNKLNEHLLTLIERFKVIDEKSRIT